MSRGNRFKSIGFQLALCISVIALIVLGTSLWNTWDARVVAKEAGVLRGHMLNETKPATMMLKAVGAVSEAVGYFARTQKKEDYTKALAKFDEVLQSLPEAGAGTAAAGVAPTEVSARIRPAVVAWRAAFEQVAKEIEISNRSVRGMGSQVSVLITFCAQQAAVTEVPPGVELGAVRKMFQTSTFKLSEVQNAVLLTYSSQDVSYVEKSLPVYDAIKANFEEIRSQVPASDLKDLLDEVSDSLKDFGDELKYLPDSFLRRMGALQQLDLAGLQLNQVLTPLLDEGMHQAIATSDVTTDRSKKLVIRLAALAVMLPLFGLLLGFLINRNIIRSLSAVIVRLTARSKNAAEMASTLSESSRVLADGAGNQAAALEETSASLEELSSMTKRNADNAHTASVSAKQALEKAQACTTQMERMQRVMDGINASSAEISKINKTIDEIAFQTNILALNAAVEAARAGTAGAGFAVVAEEVRALAQRSAQASQETATKIADAMKRSSQGLEVSGNVAQGLAEIVHSATEVNKWVGEIALASTEQSQGLSQITTAVNQMDAVTQSNAAEAGKTADAIGQFGSETEMIRGIIADLDTLVGHKCVHA